MKRTDFKFIFIVFVFAFASYFAWHSYFKVYVAEDSINIAAFPKEIAGWSSEEMTITEDEYAILETKNAFARKYRSGLGQEVYLFIVYSQNNRKVSHPPEVCYNGSGYSILSHVEDVILSHDPKVSIKVNRLLLEREHLRQIVFYYFKVGNRFTPSYWKQQIMIAWNSFLGKNVSSALIRFSANVENENNIQAEKNIREFSSRITELLPKYLP